MQKKVKMAIIKNKRCILLIKNHLLFLFSMLFSTEIGAYARAIFSMDKMGVTTLYGGFDGWIGG